MESNDVFVFHSLEEHHLIVDHLLVPSDIFLKDDFYGKPFAVALRFADNTVGSSTQRSAKLVLAPAV